MELDPIRSVGRALGPTIRASLQRPAPSSSEERAYRELIRYVDDQFAGVFDENGTMERLESLLDDDHYWQLHDAVESIARPAMLDATASTDPPYRFLLAVSGAHLADEAATFAELIQVWSAAVLRFQRWVLSQPSLADGLPAWGDASLSLRQRIDLPTTPVFLSRALLGAARWTLCMVVMATPRVVALPLGARATLFREAIHGLRRHLGVIASLPETGVPEHVIPPSERFDLDAEVRRAQQAERGFQRLLDAARASGADVYPPIAPDDQE